MTFLTSELLSSTVAAVSDSQRPLQRPPVSSITSSLNDLNVESIHIYQTSSETLLLHPLQAWLGLVLMLPQGCLGTREVSHPVMLDKCLHQHQHSTAQHSTAQHSTNQCTRGGVIAGRREPGKKRELEDGEERDGGI
ncbi:hypothetical protein U0070_024098 [Myodes glareolus]|uniref:Uncharacterized protein n=1 Tax=Myodes glareolus TaxID=447135 RepID=A0AAW0H2P4_MYOGA